MGETKRITAKEAREISETSYYLQKMVYKIINDACKRNMCVVDFSFREYNLNAVNNVFNTLKEDGYTVNLMKNTESVYEITW